MTHNIYLYILVMAGVTYLIRMLPLALSKKEITSNYIKSFFILCALCLSCRHDVSGYPVRHRKHLLGTRRACDCCDCRL